MAFTKSSAFSRQDATWNATEHPLPTAGGLTWPKPDFAVGYRATAPKLDMLPQFLSGLERSLPPWIREEDYTWSHMWLIVCGFALRGYDD